MVYSKIFDQNDETFERLWSFLANEQAYKIWLWHVRERKDDEKMLMPSQLFTVAYLGLLRSLQRFLEKGFGFVSQPVKAFETPWGFYKKRSIFDLYNLSDFSDEWEEFENCHPLTPLYAASAQGHRAIVRELLDHSVPVNDIGGPLGTALVVACHQGHHEVVDDILRAVPDKTVINYHDSLQAAAANGHLETVKILLSHGLHTNHAADQYGSAIYAASNDGNHEIVQNLLNESDDVPNIQGPPTEKYELKMFHSGLSMPMSISTMRSANDRSEGLFGNALQVASALGYFGIIESLLNNGLSPNTVGGVFGSPLQAAVTGNHVRIIDILLSFHAEVNFKGGYYGSAIEAAFVQGDLYVVEKLLRVGAIPALERFYLRCTWTAGNEILVMLMIKRLVQSGDVGFSWSYLLPRAIHLDWRLVGQELVKHGFPVSVQDGQRWTALHHAVNKRSDEDACAWVEILAKGLSSEKIQQAKDLLILKRKGKSVLHTAAAQPGQKITRILLQTAKSLGIVQDLLLDEDHAGRTPIWIAADVGTPKSIKTLILFGADPGHANKNGETALDRMRRRSSLQPFPFGIRFPGTQPGSWDEEASSFISAVRLHHAVETNNPHLAEQVIEAEERCQDIVNSTNTESGKTPLHSAAENGSSRLVDLLLQPGWKADPNIKDNAGNVPLHYAVAGAHLEVSRILVNHGTGLDIVNNERQTPFHIAWQNEDGPLMQVVTDPGNNEWISSPEDGGSFEYFSDSHGDESGGDEGGNDMQSTCSGEQERSKRRIDGSPTDSGDGMERSTKRQRRAGGEHETER